jgi:pyruvate/2-oxoglutarate dehydrogenase complex dihydrolipoamide dehydrogenase (E3) component
MLVLKGVHMRTENNRNVIIGNGEGGKFLAWQAYRRFGSNVTVLQNAGQLLSNEDTDVAAERNWCGDGR